jgi:D-ribose pyranose/furanose isomerase RbsD
MKHSIKIITLGAMLALALSQTAIAAEEKVEKKITIEEMEVKLAILAKEISEEKVKLYQKEALLNDMKLDLLKQKMKK